MKLIAARVLLAAGLAIGGAATLSATPAAAFPAIDAGPAAAAAAPVEHVRWVCGPYRCWHRPNHYWARPRPLYGYGPGWGWRRHYHHPHYWRPRPYWW